MLKLAVRLPQVILIFGVLFLVMPLTIVNFGNRYSMLANLIGCLHDKFIHNRVSLNDFERFLLKISRLSREVTADRHHPLLYRHIHCSSVVRDSSDLL